MTTTNRYRRSREFAVLQTSQMPRLGLPSRDDSQLTRCAPHDRDGAMTARSPQSQSYGMSSAFGAIFGARRRYLSMSFGFAVPARSRRKSSAARKEPTFSATAAAMNWFNDTPSVAANSAAAFFTDVGSFNG